MFPDTDLPSCINITRLLETRSPELASCLEKVYTKKKNTKRSFQLLHKSLRRRSQSHNPYRIPKTFRLGVLKELDTAIPRISKPSRKHVKSHTKLMEMYIKRSDKEFKWVPSMHIWHAKRFKMKGMWGFKIPMEPYEKNKRQLYRHASKHCTIYDRSYMKVLMLEGTEENLFEVIKEASLDYDLLNLKQFKLGGKRITLKIYERDGSLISPIQCILKFDETNPIKQLWCWCHPCGFSELKERFENILELEDFHYFELAGRKSLMRMLEVFKIMSLRKHILNFIFKAASVRKTSDMWNNLKDIYDYDPPVPNGAVMSLLIRPPKILGPFPPKYRLTPTNFAQTRTYLTELPEFIIEWPYEKLGIESSCFFQYAFNPEVAKERLPVVDPLPRRSRKRKDLRKCLEKLNRLQHNESNTANKNHWPEKNNELNRKASCIQILVIRRADSSTGYYSGYDIIIPPDRRAFNIWRLFTIEKCKVMGLLNWRRAMTEAALPAFPFDYPESRPAQEFLYQEALELYNRYKKRPPSKRTNFAFYNIPYPFYNRWEFLFMKKYQMINNPLIDRSKKVFNVYRAIENSDVSDYTTVASHIEKPLYYNVLLYITTSSIGTPSERCHLYKISNLNDFKWAYTQGWSSTFFTRYLRQKISNLTKPNFEIKPNKNWKTKFTRKNRELEDLCDEFGQTGHLFDHPDLVGFITSGHHSLSRGYGFGLAYVRLSVLQEMVQLYNNVNFPKPLLSQDIYKSFVFPFICQELNSRCVLCFGTLKPV